jgi:hypothetical protein
VRPKNKKRGQSQSGNASADRIDTQRVGYHFPNQVVDEACENLGYVCQNGTFRKVTGNYLPSRDVRVLEDQGRRIGLPTSRTAKESEEEIRGAILEGFPKIPIADLQGVLSHAFAEVQILYF